MIRHRLATFALLLTTAGVSAGVSWSASQQEGADPAVLSKAQREGMLRLALLDGEWRGPAWSLTPSGEKHDVTQTERVGPFLDGAVKVIEGRGYGADGTVSFNAFGIISYDPARKSYSLRSYAQGHVGDFVVTPAADGFSWQIPAGPMTIRYTAVIKDGKWHEVGDRIMPGRDPERFMEMNLTRLGDSSWPAGGAVRPE